MDDQSLIFGFFNEIGIVSQLSSAYLNRHLPDGVYSSHFSVLNHLCRLGDGRTPMQIASAMQVTKATMTHTLAVLEARGFVETRSNPADGRSKTVYLTASGRTFREKAIESLVTGFSAVAPKINLDHLRTALPILQELRKLLDEERATRPGPASD